MKVDLHSPCPESSRYWAVWFLGVGWGWGCPTSEQYQGEDSPAIGFPSRRSWPELKDGFGGDLRTSAHAKGRLDKTACVCGGGGFIS